MNLDVLALIATIVFVLIALFLIPMLLQIRHTVQRVDDFINVAQRDLLPLIRDLRETAENLKGISGEAEENLKRVRPFFESVEQAGEMVHSVTSSMNTGLGRMLGKSVGTWLGMRAARKAFKREITQSKRR